MSFGTSPPLMFSVKKFLNQVNFDRAFVRLRLVATFTGYPSVETDATLEIVPSLSFLSSTAAVSTVDIAFKTVTIGVEYFA